MTRTLTPISSIILSLLLFFFFVQSEYEKTTDLREEIDAYNTATDQYDFFTKILQQKLDVQESRSAYESERLDLFVPEKIDTTQLLVDIEHLAKSENMLFGNITLTEGESEQQNELYSTDISFAVIGTYDQFKSFLSALEQSITLLEVVKITFTATGSVFQQYALTIRVHALQN